MKAHAAIGAVIKGLRNAKGWTQAELTKRVGIGQANFSRLERGEQNLKAEHLRAVAHALGLSEAQLYARAGVEVPKLHRPVLSEEEVEILELYRRLGEYDRVTLKRIMVCFSRSKQRKARRK